jgi:two-component sensor histidine kinase
MFRRGIVWWQSIWGVGLPPRSVYSFLFAALCVAIATLVRIGLGLVSADITVFAPYYSATLVAALVGGPAAGVLAAVSGGSVALLLFVPPDWGLRPFILEQSVSVLLFSASSTVIIWAAESYRRLLRRLREEEETRRLLNHELNHRIRNILSSVQAIANQTLKGQKETRDKMNERLASLATTNDILTRSEWRSAPLREILISEFTPYDLSRFHMAGEDVECLPSIATPLALLFHELTTNASKYGALSLASGRVSVTWKNDRNFELEWIERGGPEPKEVMRHGFGTRLLETALKQLDGTVKINFEPAGLHVKLSLALPRNSQSRTAHFAEQRPTIELSSIASTPERRGRLTTTTP